MGKKNSVGLPESIAFAPAAGQLFGYRKGMGMIKSAEWIVGMEDFDQLVWTTNVPNGWDGTVIDTGATLVADTTAGYPSCALFDSDGTNEGACLYGDKFLQLTATKRFFMECRFQTEVAADTTVQFGLSALTATTNPEDIWTTTATDVVAFGILTGDATTTMLADKSNSGATAELGTIDLVDATWHTLAIYYDGYFLYGYVDGVFSIKWSQAAATTIPTGVVLAPFVGFLNGTTGAAQEGHCDYLRWVLER